MTAISNTPRLLLKVAEAAAMLGIGRTKVYDLINQRRLPAISLGPKCTRVAVAALEAFVAQKAV